MNEPRSHPESDPLNDLHLLDPELARRMIKACDELDPPPPSDMLRWLVDEIKWGLNLEISFGLVLAEGCLALLRRNDFALLRQYGRLVRNAGQNGPTFGRLMARHLVPVLGCRNDGLLERFKKTIAAMTAKGTYTLKAPLAALEKMLEAGEAEAAAEYLDLLRTAFIKDLSYNQSQHFSLRLPQAALGFRPEKRLWQLRALHRIVCCDIGLVDPFLDGMAKGLQLLSQESLTQFVATGLDRAGCDHKAGSTFLNLDAGRGIDYFSRLQNAASLQQVQPQLNRYLRARTGRSMAVRPLSLLPQPLSEISREPIRVCSDGRFIYLPEEIERFDAKSENVKLYRCLVRFESGQIEFGTYDFDLQKLHERRQRRRGAIPAWLNLEKENPRPAVQSDLELFFSTFPHPGLAADLFTVFEHGRVRRCLERHYPGMIRNFLPMLQEEAGRMFTAAAAVHPVHLLYAEIALAASIHGKTGTASEMRQRLEGLVEAFNRETEQEDAAVEVSAELTMASYRVVEDLLAAKDLVQSAYQSVALPFGRTLHPALHHLARGDLEKKAQVVKERLARKGYHIYRSDLRKCLEDSQGVLSAQDLCRLVRMIEHREPIGDAETWIAANDIHLPEIVDGVDRQADPGAVPESVVSWYPEWDGRLGDYLSDYVRVVDRIPAAGPSEFYARTLDRYRGLVKQIRYAFELIRPEGLKLYRRWIEGDAFDYRALLDFAIDRRARRTPSERLYLKRVKELRDVAALLLVDLSRSTANPVFGSSATVLDVEKEAVVLFSEALEVVGDTYAIAGFSGTGRLGVDYFHIKDFDEAMDTCVRDRINAVTPQRNTRMGAAIRHAATQFAQSQARVRLLIVLGDGFPNDLNYKKEYAVEDTRKAIAELRAMQIHVHAITVNVQTSGSSKLDEIYGDIHHTLIVDVSELPDKLLRIYGKLTQR